MQSARFPGIERNLLEIEVAPDTTEFSLQSTSSGSLRSQTKMAPKEDLEIETIKGPLAD